MVDHTALTRGTHIWGQVDVWDEVLVAFPQSGKAVWPSEFLEGFSHAFSCDCLTAQILPLSSLTVPPELVPRVLPCTFPVLQSPSQTLTPKNKTCDSCVQEWSEREGPPVRVFGAEAHIGRVTMRISSLVWCGSEIGPGIREQDNFKTLFTMNWDATVKINAPAGIRYKSHLRNIGKYEPEGHRSSMQKMFWRKIMKGSGPADQQLRAKNESQRTF